MSSSPSSTPDPSAPSTPQNLPCMFTVEQFQQATPSYGSNSDPSYVYIVRPTAIWESLERFKRLVIQGDKEKYQTHDTVTVTRHDLPNSPLWAALILEIRGHKPSAQVFLRVFWFYEPSHLPPALRASHHGRHELLASNAMAVVDAMAVTGHANVLHWRGGNEPVPAPGRLFWRQTYDVQREELSVRAGIPAPPKNQNTKKPKTHKEKAPSNPLLLLACPSSPPCAALTHKSCLLTTTLARLQAETSTSLSPPSSASETNNKKKTGSSNNQQKEKLSDDEQEEKEEDKAMPILLSGIDRRRGPGGFGGILIGEDGGQGEHVWVEEDVRCLRCGGVMMMMMR